MENFHSVSSELAVAALHQAGDLGVAHARAAYMFWGDRYGRLEDPFGHHWSVGTHVRDVSMEEMQQAMRKAGG